MRAVTAIISIDKLTADAIAPLTAALKLVPGVQSIDFSLERSVAVVEFDGGEAKVDDLLRAVQKAGYRVI
jgi:copper chaperone CopZ